MSCFLCAGDVCEDLLMDGVTWRWLCDLIEIKSADYQRILAPALFCHKCQQLLDPKSSQLIDSDSLEKDSCHHNNNSLDDDNNRRKKLNGEERRKNVVIKSLISSWMKLQCENFQAKDYCSWQSVRLKILIDIGAVMEMVECPGSTVECECIVEEVDTEEQGTNSKLPLNISIADFHLPEGDSATITSESDQADRKDPPESVSVPVPTMNGQWNPPNVSERSDDDDLMAKPSSDSCPSEKNQISGPFPSPESSNVPSKLTPNPSDSEKGRRSKRKLLKPTKGIYQLEAAPKTVQEPFHYGSKLRELLTMNREQKRPGASDNMDNADIKKSRVEPTNLSGAQAEKVEEDVKEEKAEVVTPTEGLKTFKSQDDVAEAMAKEEKEDEIKSSLLDLQPSIGGPEEIEAAAVLNIMKHSKGSEEKSPEFPKKTSRWPRRRKQREVSETFDKELRSRVVSYSPDITQTTGSTGRGRQNERPPRRTAAERKAYPASFEPLKMSGTTNQQHISADSGPGQKVGKFVCEYEECGRVFPTEERRQNHCKRSHEGIRNLFSCSICGKSFPARTRLATHLERHKEEGQSHACTECPKTFSTKKKLDFHLYQHSQNWGLYCDVCNKGFPPGQELRLANHKKIHDESRPRPYKCTECDRTFSSQQYLNIHTKNHPITPDPDGLFRCPFETCGQTFKAVTSYREHMKIHTGELPFECDVCGKKFGYITGYKKHMISHTDEKHHTCHICGKQFKQKGNLNLHISRHAGVKPYKCDHPGCGYSFFDQYKLKNHMDVHTGRRSYKCEECEKFFRTSTGLKSHYQAVHAKERKYKCHCGKAFSQKQYLQFHKTQHPELNLKRFTCDFCGKKFSEPSSLREHKRRFHTGETAFRCDKCSYTACFKSRMEKHLLTHASPQLKCEECGKLFRHQNNLQRHIGTVHTGSSKTKAEGAAQA